LDVILTSCAAAMTTTTTMMTTMTTTKTTTTTLDQDDYLSKEVHLSKDSIDQSLTEMENYIDKHSTKMDQILNDLATGNY